MSEKQKVVGILELVKPGDRYTDIKVAGQFIRAWNSIKTNSGEIPNPVLAKVQGVSIGQTVEAEYNVVDKLGKKYYNLSSLSIQVGEPKGQAEQSRRTYGKSPEEQAAIMIEATHKVVGDFLGNVLTRVDLAYLEENRERIERLISTMTDTLLDYILTKVCDVTRE